MKCFLSFLSLGLTANRLLSPIGLYYDEMNQNLYISNAGNAATVARWRIGDGSGTFVAGSSGNPGSSSSRLSFPAGITMDRWQNLYVNDRANDRIQLFCNGSSTGITIVGAGAGAGGTSFSQAFDAKLDSRLNLYLADSVLHRVIKFFKL